MSNRFRIARLIAVVTLSQCALACTESISETVDGESEALYYATAVGAAGSAGFIASRTATIYTEAPSAADELVARVHGEPERPGGFTTPQHTEQIEVSWSCDDGKGGKNTG